MSARPAAALRMRWPNGGSGNCPAGEVLRLAFDTAPVRKILAVMSDLNRFICKDFKGPYDIIWNAAKSPILV